LGSLRLPARVFLVTDTRVGGLYGEEATAVLKDAGYSPTLLTVPRGDDIRSQAHEPMCALIVAAEAQVVAHDNGACQMIAYALQAVAGEQHAFAVDVEQYQRMVFSLAGEMPCL
jgi:hypothetical protein